MSAFAQKLNVYGRPAATLLHLNDNQPWLIAGYMVLVSIVSLISVAFLGDRTGKDLAEIDRMGAAAAAR